MHNYENEGAGQLPGEALTGAIQAEKYGPAMDLALHQAALSAQLGEVPVGAVLINDDGEVISQAATAVRNSMTPPLTPKFWRCVAPASSWARVIWRAVPWW